MTAPPGYYDGLGASVCAAILGQDANKTPYTVWSEFVDPETRPNLEDNEAVEAGVALEPAIAAWAAKRLGVQIDYKPGALIKHKALPFMQCHPDALVVGTTTVSTSSRLDGSPITDYKIDAPYSGLEVKNRGLQTMRLYSSLEDFVEESDRAQVSEVLQCHASMAVTGFDHWYLAVAVGGQKLLTFRINRDESIIKVIEAKYAEMWDYIQRREPPPPVNVDDCYKLWPNQKPGTFMEATPELADVVEQRRILKAKIKEAKDEADFLEFKIKAAMQDVEELRYQGKKLCTWKHQHRKSYVVEATDMRVMR